jgi:hypothetical protein
MLRLGDDPRSARADLRAREDVTEAEVRTLYKKRIRIRNDVVVPEEEDKEYGKKKEKALAIDGFREDVRLGRARGLRGHGDEGNELSV